MSNSDDFPLHYSFLALEKLGFYKENDCWNGESYDLEIWTIVLRVDVSMCIVLEYSNGDPSGQLVSMLFNDYDFEVNANRMSDIKNLMKYFSSPLPTPPGTDLTQEKGSDEKSQTSKIHYQLSDGTE